MAWRIEFEERAAKDLEKLDPPVVRRILGFQQAKPGPSLPLRMTKQNQALTALRTSKPKQAQILPRFAPQDDKAEPGPQCVQDKN